MNEDKFPANAQTMNALIDGMGALTFALVSALPPDRRGKAAEAMAILAKNAEKKGALTLETLLLDLHRAAQSASTLTND